MLFFLRIVLYYRLFIEEFSKIAAPLTKMLKNNCPFVWEDDAKTAFAKLRTRLANAPILIYPDFNFVFLLDSDALDKGISGVCLNSEWTS